MEELSVFLQSPVKGEGDDTSSVAPTAGQQTGVNIVVVHNPSHLASVKIVNAPKGAIESQKDKFQVFYIDYSNHEEVSYSNIRPLDPSVALDSEISICAAMPHDGIARLEKRRPFETKDRKMASDNLEKFQEEARKSRLEMWQYGDFQSDKEDNAPVRKAGDERVLMFKLKA